MRRTPSPRGSHAARVGAPRGLAASRSGRTYASRWKGIAGHGAREDPVVTIVWRPSKEYVERANVTRFMRTHGIATYEELLARSVGDVAWFWDAVVKDLGIEFFEPYTQVLDTSHGIEWATWFGGGS